MVVNFRSIIILSCLLTVGRTGHSQNQQKPPGFETVRLFYETMAGNPSADDWKKIGNMFTDDATVRSITYDSLGAVQVKTIFPTEYVQIMSDLLGLYSNRQKPVKAIVHSYGAYCHVMTGFEMALMKENLEQPVSVNGVADFHLVRDDGFYFIQRLTIQNQKPGVPFPEELWDTSVLLPDTGFSEVSFYYGTEVFDLGELDQKPEIAEDSLALKSHAANFQFRPVAAEESVGSWFYINIDEAGVPTMGESTNLNDDQRLRAENFANALPYFLAGVKDEANVKSRIKFAPL